MSNIIRFRQCTTAVAFQILGVSCCAVLSFPGHGFADAYASAASQGGVRDFVAYWSAARLLLEGANPYSPAALLLLQRSAGMTEPTPLIMWNPPWVLSLILPLGMMDFLASQFVWLLLNVVLVMFSAQWLLQLYGGRESEIRSAWLLAFGFMPGMYSLILGQITPVVLFGLTIFLLVIEGKNRLHVSLALSLLAIKPHVAYLFWLAVALWLWFNREWRILLGTASIIAIASLFPLLFDDQIYSHYIDVHRSGDYLKPLDLPAPSLRNVLIIFFGAEGSVFEYLPTLAGCAWLIFYWRHYRHKWIWKEQLPLLLLVSIATSPYSWTFDHIILLPAIIQSYLWLRSYGPSVVMLAYLGCNSIFLSARYIVLIDFWYFWMAPLFLGAYLFMQKRRSELPYASAVPPRMS